MVSCRRPRRDSRHHHRPGGHYGHTELQIDLRRARVIRSESQKHLILKIPHRVLDEALDHELDEYEERRARERRRSRRKVYKEHSGVSDGRRVLEDHRAKAAVNSPDGQQVSGDRVDSGKNLRLDEAIECDLDDHMDPEPAARRRGTTPKKVHDEHSGRDDRRRVCESLRPKGSANTSDDRKFPDIRTDARVNLREYLQNDEALGRELDEERELGTHEERRMLPRKVYHEHSDSDDRKQLRGDYRAKASASAPDGQKPSAPGRDLRIISKDCVASDAYVLPKITMRDYLKDDKSAQSMSSGFPKEVPQSANYRKHRDERRVQPAVGYDHRMSAANTSDLQINASESVKKEGVHQSSLRRDLNGNPHREDEEKLRERCHVGSVANGVHLKESKRIDEEARRKPQRAVDRATPHRENDRKTRGEQRLKTAVAQGHHVAPVFGGRGENGSHIAQNVSHKTSLRDTESKDQLGSSPDRHEERHKSSKIQSRPEMDECDLNSDELSRNHSAKIGNEQTPKIDEISQDRETSSFQKYPQTKNIHKEEVPNFANKRFDMDTRVRIYKRVPASTTSSLSSNQR